MATKASITAAAAKAKSTSDKMYDDLISEQESLNEQQNQYLDEYSQTTQDNLTKQYEQTQNQIQSQISDTEQDLADEKKAANVSYQQAINPYGVEAENQASQGLQNSGYSETVKGAMYTSMQTRITEAKTTAQKIIADYNLQLDQAKVDYDVEAAEIALEVMAQRLQYNADLLSTTSSYEIAKFESSMSIDETYYQRLQDLIDNQQAAASLAEEKRQFNILYGDTELTDSDSEEEITDLSGNTVSGTTSVSATYSPTLSSSTAQNWLSKNLSSTLTASSLESSLLTAYQAGTLTADDIKKIAKSYGLE